MSARACFRMLVALLLAVLAGGCAVERTPINRVQANAMAKSFFVGPDLSSPADDPEFYTAATVVDVPYGEEQGGLFPGMVGTLRRIKWEITEKYLNARLTYESVDGIDGHGAKTTNNGEVIASYEITSHFDIRHGYNQSTGEELNVIEENTTDRPWYQREYFRVDWSINYVQSARLWDPLAGNDFDVEPLAYYVNDPSSPDAPHFVPEEGYFDITNRLFLEPKTIDLGSGPMPACYYRGSLVVGATYPWGACESLEITVRYSYRQVPTEDDPDFGDYEPKNWDGSRMNAFGIFTRDRLGWDRLYGIVDEKWRRFAQRYNIWQRSHRDQACVTKESLATGCDPERDGDSNCNGKLEPELGEVANGTADECEQGDNWGSRCDVLVGKCTIPYAKRDLRPVAWHYTVNTEDTLIFDSTELATWQWDAAIRLAVQAGRYSECVRTGTASLKGSRWKAHYQPGATIADARTLCGQAFPIDQSYDDADLDRVRDVNMCVKNGTSRDQCLEGVSPDSVAAIEPMVVLCHNPVGAADAPACGPAGTMARPGDIRFHQVNLWPTRQSVSPWGYGPSLSDPLTGEIISAGINVYNSVTDSAARSFMDQVRWMNGEINAADITSGKHVHDWVLAGDFYSQQNGWLLSKDYIDRHLSGMTGLSLADVKQAPELAKTFDTAKLAQMIRQLDREALPPGTIPEDRSVFDHRIALAKESGVEAELMNSMWLQMAGVEDDMPPDKQREMASPLRGMSSQQLLRAFDEAQVKLAEQGQCLLGAPEPTGIPAVAKMIAKKFPLTEGASPTEQQARLAKIWDYLRYKLNYTVIIHEMGHTIGLRHNFVSSYDKYAYKTQYWQLRTDSGKQKTICDGPQTDGSKCIGPRYYDPLTQDEIDNSIWTWMQSTVMDYPGDLTQDMLGLGVYDLAAARMFYADTVDVRRDVTIDDPVGEGVEALVDYPGYLFGQTANCPQGTGKCSLNPNTGLIGHYSYYNEAFKLVQPERCYAVTPQAPSGWDADRLGPWDPLWDGHIVHGERCARPPVDYVQWEDMVPDQIVVDFDDPDYFTPRRASEKCWVPASPESPTGECLDGRHPRVPYGFLTDQWADGWSPSAYRHDNGADMYEEVVFHTNLYENRHIFDNFRNGRVDFTIYGAYQRALSRYHAKVEALTQGFAYGVDFILREFAKGVGAPFATVLAVNAGEGGFLYDHAVAASVGFDHFVRVLTRPHTGEHYCEGGLLGCSTKGDRLLHPAEDEVAGVPAGSVTAGYIPNGNMIAGDSVSHGGRPLNNDFQYAHGHWTFDYLNQAGSYYEKTYTLESMLNASYGAINFYRFDGLDARFRHVNFGDLFPEGMRRLIGVALTEDQQLLGARVASNAKGQPDMAPLTEGGHEYPAQPMAWVSYVPADGPLACAPVGDVLSCVDSLGTPIQNGASTGEAYFVDPQIGYEVQKFIVFWFYVYQAGKEQLDWAELARIYRLGTDLNPEYLPTSVVEWRDPETGLRYLAKRYGDESIFGKTYDRGIAAKMIQWANILSGEVYKLDPNEPYDPVTGAANVLFDGQVPLYKGGGPDDNKKWLQLRRYRGLLDFTRDTAAKLGFPEPALQIFSPDD